LLLLLGVLAVLARDLLDVGVFSAVDVPLTSAAPWERALRVVTIPYGPTAA
jgi:hypothetical protein